jgi:hypothetical protein
VHDGLAKLLTGERAEQARKLLNDDSHVSLRRVPEIAHEATAPPLSTIEPLQKSLPYRVKGNIIADNQTKPDDAATHNFSLPNIRSHCLVTPKESVRRSACNWINSVKPKEPTPTT